MANTQAVTCQIGIRSILPSLVRSKPRHAPGFRSSKLRQSPFLNAFPKKIRVWNGCKMGVGR